MERRFCTSYIGCETSAFSQDVVGFNQNLKRVASTFYITTKPGVTFS